MFRRERVRLAGIGLLVRRRMDVPDGVELPYTAPQRPMIIVFFVVSLVESGAFLLVDFGPVGGTIPLVSEIYTAAWLLGNFAALITRPHVLSSRASPPAALASWRIDSPWMGTQNLYLMPAHTVGS